MNKRWTLPKFELQETSTEYSDDWFTLDRFTSLEKAIIQYEKRLKSSRKCIYRILKTEEVYP